MIIALRCSGCGRQFGVDRFHVKGSKETVEVRREFHCPYCLMKYAEKDKVRADEVSGGVQIVGEGNLKVGGDIVGGDKYG